MGSGGFLLNDRKPWLLQITYFHFRAEDPHVLKGFGDVMCSSQYILAGFSSSQPGLLGSLLFSFIVPLMLNCNFAMLVCFVLVVMAKTGKDWTTSWFVYTSHFRHIYSIISVILGTL